MKTRILQFGVVVAIIGTSLWLSSPRQSSFHNIGQGEILEELKDAHIEYSQKPFEFRVQIGSQSDISGLEFDRRVDAMISVNATLVDLRFIDELLRSFRPIEIELTDCSVSMDAMCRLSEEPDLAEVKIARCHSDGSKRKFCKLNIANLTIDSCDNALVDAVLLDAGEFVKRLWLTAKPEQSIVINHLPSLNHFVARGKILLENADLGSSLVILYIENSSLSGFCLSQILEQPQLQILSLIDTELHDVESAPTNLPRRKLATVFFSGAEDVRIKLSTFLPRGISIVEREQRTEPQNIDGER